MENIVDAYLVFTAANVMSYVDIMVNERYQRKMPQKLNDVIYDFYNEVYLGKEYLDSASLEQITGLKKSHSDDERTLFKLLIEYGITSRMALKNKETFEYYLFVINAIILFIHVEEYSHMNTYGSLSVDQAILKSKRKLKDNFVPFIKYARTLSDNLENKFQENSKKIAKFDETYERKYTDIEYVKIETNDDSLYTTAAASYRNKDLDEYSDKEIYHVKKELDVNLFFMQLEYIVMDLLREMLCGKTKMKVFIYVPNEVFDKKTSLKNLTDILGIFGIKKNIVLIINYTVTVDKIDTIDILLEKGFEIAGNKDGELPKQFTMNGAQYFMADYQHDAEFDRIQRRVKMYGKLIIRNKISRKDKVLCKTLGIQYFMKSK